jgi:hypothetical protein
MGILGLNFHVRRYSLSTANMVNAVSAVICFILQSPAEKLSVTCSKYTETELDKILLNLETKEFIVEPGEIG